MQRSKVQNDTDGVVCFDTDDQYSQYCGRDNA